MPEPIQVTVTPDKLPPVSLRFYSTWAEASAYAGCFNETVYYVQTNGTYYVIDHGRAVELSRNSTRR